MEPKNKEAELNPFKDTEVGKIKSIFKAGDLVTCAMFEGVFIVQKKVGIDGIFITVKNPEDYYHFTDDGRFFKTYESKQVLFKEAKGFRVGDIVENYRSGWQYQIIDEPENEYENYYLFSPIGSITDYYSNSNARVEFTEAHERFFLVERPDKKEEAPKAKRKLSRYLVTNLETGENRVTPSFFSEEGFLDSDMIKAGIFVNPALRLKKYGEEIEVDW